MKRRFVCLFGWLFLKRRFDCLFVCLFVCLVVCEVCEVCLFVKARFVFVV